MSVRMNEDGETYGCEKPSEPAQAAAVGFSNIGQRVSSSEAPGTTQKFLGITEGGTDPLDQSGGCSGKPNKLPGAGSSFPEKGETDQKGATDNLAASSRLAGNIGPSAAGHPGIGQAGQGGLLLTESQGSGVGLSRERRAAHSGLRDAPVFAGAPGEDGCAKIPAGVPGPAAPELGSSSAAESLTSMRTVAPRFETVGDRGSTLSGFPSGTRSSDVGLRKLAQPQTVFE